MGMSIILGLVIIASLVVSLRFMQGANIQLTQNHLKELEQKVTSQQSKESDLTVIKNRLNLIGSLTNASKQRQMYKLVSSQIPDSINVSSSSVDRSGDVLISATTADGIGIDGFVTGLIDSVDGKDAISRVSIENLSRDRDGVYRFNLRIIAK